MQFGSARIWAFTKHNNSHRQLHKVSDNQIKHIKWIISLASPLWTDRLSTSLYQRSLPTGRLPESDGLTCFSPIQLGNIQAPSTQPILHVIQLPCILPCILPETTSLVSLVWMFSSWHTFNTTERIASLHKEIHPYIFLEGIWIKGMVFGCQHLEHLEDILILNPDHCGL